MSLQSLVRSSEGRRSTRAARARLMRMRLPRGGAVALSGWPRGQQTRQRPGCEDLPLKLDQKKIMIIIIFIIIIIIITEFSGVATSGHDVFERRPGFGSLTEPSPW